MIHNYWWSMKSPVSVSAALQVLPATVLRCAAQRKGFSLAVLQYGAVSPALSPNVLERLFV